MKACSIFALLPWIFTGAAFAAADTTAANDLISQIQAVRASISNKVNGTPASNADGNAILDLNTSKIQLFNLLDQDIDQLKKDAANSSLSSSTQGAIKKRLDDDQAEKNSLNASLGHWTDGTAASTGQPVQANTSNPSGAPASASTQHFCVVQAKAPAPGPSKTIYTFTANCSGISPTAIAVEPGIGKLDVKTMVASSSTLNAPQYSADRKFVTFGVPTTSTAQSFQFELPNAAAKNNGVRGSYYISSGNTDIVTCEGTPTAAGCYSGAIQLPAVDEHAVSQVFQGLVGGAISGASSADPRSNFQAEGKLDLPLTRHKDNNIEANFDLTAYAKIGAMQTFSSVSSLFSTTTSAFTTVLNNTSDKIVQSYEMGGSVGWKIPHALWKQGDNLFTLSMIGEGGMLTPLSPGQVQPALYIATDPTVQAYFENNGANSNNLAGSFATACKKDSNGNPLPCYVQVYPEDRLQFFRQYGGGLRLKFYAKDTTVGHEDYRFPGNLDLTVGQNEYVTAGKMGRAVLHFGGEIPVPGVDYVYLTLGMDSALKKDSSPIAPLLLSPSAAPTDTTTVVNVVQPQQNRDRYSVGVSFDIAHLLNHGGTPSSGNPPPTITTQPESQSIQSGSSTSLSVSATGSGTLSYQWYEGESPNTTIPVSGATNFSFKTPLLTTAKSYWVQVTNTVNGTTATIPSNTADITIK